MSLRADAADADPVSTALAEVLASTLVHQRSDGIAADIAASPGPAAAIQAVEALVPSSCA